MNPKEQEIAISELEDRVDRLRNIYEQYFLGFERLEPTVPRKDVDRRFAILRKEQIRNTAMRFRLNVITQKFNTYAMHWVRICRQIEEGTYKRHVRRAKARFGDGPNGPSPKERDIFIDVDTSEFDMDAVLDEINAESAARKRLPPDTLPPPPSERAAASARAILATPGSSFAVAGRTGSDLERTTDTMGAVGERAARGAALPPGTKPRMIVRKRDEAEPDPPSARVPAAPPAASPPGSSPSAGRIPNAPPASAPAASGGHQHVAPKGAPDRPQIRPIGSVNRNPIATPVSTPRVPIAPPASAPRVPAAPSHPRPPLPPLPPPSAARLPAAPPASAQRIPNAPGSSPKLPVPPLPRPPAPSFVDNDTDPGAPDVRPPGTRPRIPLPLPSQATRPPTKKD